MERKNQVDQDNLAYAKANFESAKSMIEALQTMSSGTKEGELIGARDQTGYAMAKLLFATGIIAIMHVSLMKGHKDVEQFLAEGKAGYRLVLTDALQSINDDVAQLIRRCEKVLQYAASTNLPDPYTSDGFDLGKMASDIGSEARSVDQAIAQLAELMAT